MAKTWTLEYKSIRTGEWLTLGRCYFGRTPLAVVKQHHPELLILKREWRCIPGPDKPKPKIHGGFSIPLPWG